jgi:hypothetical protein
MKEHHFFHSFIFLSLLGYLFLGIAHVSILPPWEGFDETAHYSYLQEVADTHTLPRHGQSLMSNNVEQYKHFAPMPYSIVPPFENNSGLTYKSFFEMPYRIQNSSHDFIHNRPADPRHYAPGKEHNWQSQHPPLYYIMLSPIYLASRHFGWAAQLFILRLTSYLFAWVALIIALLGCFGAMNLHTSTENKLLLYWMVLGLCIWPLMIPSWFPEMARLGNDSLCALIMAFIWFFSVRAFYSRLSLKYSIALGVFLGLGCLTKAFFVPVSIGILGFWLVRQWELTGLENYKHFIGRLIIMFTIILFISGWWYLANWLQYGVFTGSDEMIALNDKGGLLEGLKENFSVKAWLRGHAALITTLGWSGTWSLARPPYIYLAPMAIIVIFITISYIFAIRHYKITDVAWIPAWSSAFVLIGFSIHVLTRIALTGEGRGTSGYYLHFLVAPLGAGLGIGFSAAWHKKVFRQVTSIFILYAAAFGVAISWAQLLLFSGIIYKHGANKFYQLPETLPFSLGLPEALIRLKKIVYPNLGLIAWLCGCALLLTAILFAWKIGHQLILEENGLTSNVRFRSATQRSG